MSAALSSDPLFDRLAALTCAHPTADDLRVRAEFWREYVRTTPGLSRTCAGLVDQNCAGMVRLADQMDNPAPVVSLVPKRKVVKPAAIAAERFWELHSAAVSTITRAHGPSWRNDHPEETVEVTLPVRLCSMIGKLGNRIRWRRDWRMPAAAYWAGGALPEGVEALPVAPRYDGPMGDDHPGMVTWHSAIRDAVYLKRRRGGRDVIAKHWWGVAVAELFRGIPYERRKPAVGQWLGDGRDARVAYLARAERCRVARLKMADELAEFRVFSPAYPRMES